MPFNIENWSYVQGVQSFDAYLTPYLGEQNYSVLRVDGVLRLAALSSDGNSFHDKAILTNGQPTLVTGTEVTLVGDDVTQFTGLDNDDQLAINDVLSAQGASAASAIQVTLAATATFFAPITIAAGEALMVDSASVSGPITFAGQGRLDVAQQALANPKPNDNVHVLAPVIQNFGAGDEIDLTGLQFNATTLDDNGYSISDDTLTVSERSLDDQLTFSSAPSAVVLGSDGRGGTAVFASLGDAILAANGEASPATGATDLIFLAPAASAQTAALPAIDLASNVELTIDDPLVGSTGLVIDNGKVVLDPTQANGAAGQSTYSGGTLIDGGVLQLDGAGAAGSGAISFGPGLGTLAFDAASAPTNLIEGFAIGQGVLDIQGIGTATSATVSGDVLTVSGGVVGGVAAAPVTLYLDPSQNYATDTFVPAPDAATNGTFVRVLQTNYVVTSEATLNQAIQAIDSGGGSSLPNLAYSITFDLAPGDDHTLKLSSPLDAINLASGSSLTIDGLDGVRGAPVTLNGEGIERGLFVYAGDVSIDDLTVANAKAIGGAGGAYDGGGGGAGLGGGLFVASGGAVTLDNVSFIGDSATAGVIADMSGSVDSSGGTIIDTAANIEAASAALATDANIVTIRSNNPDHSFQIKYLNILNGPLTSKTVQYLSSGKPASATYSNGETAAESAKDSDIVGVRVALERLLHQQRQRAEPFPHVGVAARQPNPHAARNRISSRRQWRRLSQ